MNSAKNADELIDPFALIPIGLDVNNELFNIVGGTFAWVWTNFYIEATVTSRRMQVAMSYNTTNHKMAFRIYGSSGWLPWKEIATSDNVPKTAADVGALPDTGGTVNGQIIMKKVNDNGTARFAKNHNETDDYGFVMTDFDKDGNAAGLNIRANRQEVNFVDKDKHTYTLYHTGNKPTPEDIGAAPAYTYGTEDLEAGVSELETGKLYFVLE